MTPLEFPARINVEVTNRCNQRCRCCPRDAFTRPLGLMDPALFRSIADELARHDTTLWLHFLGEPLLHPGLVDMARYAVDAGVRSVGLSTNATLLQGEIVDALITSGIHRLDCSIDAADAETYRLMRGCDDFQRATHNTATFLRRRDALGSASPSVSLQLVLTPEVRASIPAVVEQWEPLLSEGDFIKTIEPASFGGAISQGTLPTTGDRPPCQWLFTSLMILQDGTITMCGNDWDGQAPLGRIDEAGSIEAVWHGAEMSRRRRAHLLSDFESVHLCGDCTDWHLADGHGYRNARDSHASDTQQVTLRPRASVGDPTAPIAGAQVPFRR